MLLSFAPKTLVDRSIVLARSSGFSVTTDSAVEMAYQWLEKHHIDLAPSKVWSIDCVFTGHRTDTHQSFVVSDGPPANFAGAISSYTALGVTLVCDDGKYFPTILYTHNPIFNRERNPIPREGRAFCRTSILCLLTTRLTLPVSCMCLPEVRRLPRQSLQQHRTG